VPRAHDVGRCGFYLKVDRAVVSLLSKADWSWGCVAAVDSRGRTIFVDDAHRGDGNRFVVRADEKLTAFVELELAIRHAIATTIG
jgi:hypothetical protein